jgi:hypothetical protein
MEFVIADRGYINYLLKFLVNVANKRTTQSETFLNTSEGI